MSSSTDLIDTIVSQYLKVFPESRTNLAALIEQITNDDQLDNPKTLPGHATGSAYVLSPGRDKVLLIHHKFLKRWLQPGGHWDPGESDPLAAARREALEETAVQISEYIALDSSQPLLPFDIDTHEIPERPEKQMPAHLHHDFRYCFVAEHMELTGLDTEVNEAKWFSFDAPECSEVVRVIQKMKDLKFIKT